MIWAAGKAGWYEISPSDRYLPYYNDTIEAIDLFYFMVDQHQKLPKKRQRLGFMVDPFLTEYQKHTGYRINDDDEAMETIHKHHRFLLKQMIEEREDIDWSETHLWRHLAETYPEVVESLRMSLAQMNGVTPAVQSDADSESSEGESSSVEALDEEEEEKSEESTTSDTSPAKSEPDQSESSSDEEEEEDPIASTDWTSIIWDLLNILRKMVSFDMRRCGIESLANEVRKLHAFPGDHKAAVRAIERSAEPLLKKMNEAKLRKKFNWSTRAIYDELEATLADEVAHEIIKTPAGKGARKPHRMKSVLRPSGASKARKRTKGAVADSQDEDEEMMDQSISSPVLKRNGGPLEAQASRKAREETADTAYSREDSPSRQLNGYHDPNRLPSLPPGPETQEMLDLVSAEAKKVGRIHQTSHLQAFLEQMMTE